MLLSCCSPVTNVSKNVRFVSEFVMERDSRRPFTCRVTTSRIYP